MKLTWFLILALTLQTSASLWSQTTRMDVDLKNSSLLELFTQIENNSEYRFFYSNDEVDVMQRVTINAKQEVIGDILTEAFKELPYAFKELRNNMILVEVKDETAISVQQQKSISGKVTDENGDELPGVTVIIKGTTQGTVTGSDGNYSITDVPNNATLIFSFVGMRTQEIVVGDQTSIDVSLAHDAIGMDEVVVVGYGAQKKVNLTGAIATVSAEELENRSVSSVKESLQGMVSNLIVTTTDGGRPGSDLNLSIRGVGTIGDANSDPLVIIDGVPGDIDAVNSDDIESISVLKDAAASAIYGSRGAYGVIIITTKNGEEGKMQIRYSNNFSLNSPTNPWDKMNSVDFANYFNQARVNNGANPIFNDVYLDEIQSHFENPESPSIVPHTSDPIRWGHEFGNNDWFDLVYKDFSLSQKHTLTLSGGKDFVKYYFSGGYNKENGLYNYGEDSYKKYNILANVSAKVTKWAEVSYKMQFTRRDWLTPSFSDLQYDAFRRWPTNVPVDPNGHFTRRGEALHAAEEGGADRKIRNSYDNTLRAVLTPLKGLTIVGDFTINHFGQDRVENVKKLYHYDTSGEIYGTQRWNSKSIISKEMQLNDYTTTNVYASYDFELNKSKFGFTAGFQQESNHFKSLEASRNDMLSEDVLSLNIAAGENLTASDRESEWAVRGYFGRINYNYADKILFEANGRYDGSSRFPEDLQWGFFPSVSLGYRISEENFFKPLNKAINNLKLRGSYGRLGNSNVKSNYYIPTIGRAQTDYIGADGTYLEYVTRPGFGNYNITWEKPTTFNLGLDLTTFNGLFGLTFDYFERETIDMVGPQEPLPEVLGDVVPKTNNTEMKTTGFELDLSHQNKIGDFNYGLKVNIASYKRVITEYYNPNQLITTYYKGKELGEIWGFETVGFINTEEDLANMNDQTLLGNGWGLGDIMYKDQNGDGKITKGSSTLDDLGDLVRIGNTTPSYNYSISANCAWKGLDFRMLWTGLGKTDWWPSSGQGSSNNWTDEMFFGNSNNIWNFTALNDHKDHWTEDNHNAYYPTPLVGNNNAYRSTQVQTKYLQNRSFIRLKNVQLGYNFSNKLIKKIGATKLRLYVTGENLLTFTELRIFDPETPGVIYPLAKTYSVGLNVNF